MGSPKQGAEDPVHSDTGSPSLSQMLFKRKPPHMAFRYPVNEFISSKDTNQGSISSTPSGKWNAKPETPASAPANVQSRSGSKSLGMRRRLKSVENHASPCLRRKRTALNEECHVIVNGKKHKSVVSSRGLASENNITTETTVNKANVPKDGSNCCRVELNEKTMGSVSVGSFDRLIPTVSGFKTARNNAIKISSQAFRRAELLFSKMENQDIVLSAQQTSNHDEKCQKQCEEPHQTVPKYTNPLPNVQETTKRLGFQTTFGNGCMKSAKILDEVSNLLHEVQSNREDRIGVKESVDTPNANTSPVLQNRKSLKKILKRRKILFQSTSRNPDCVTVNEGTITKSSDQDKLDDSSFLSDGLDSELLAMDLDSKSIIAVKSGVVTAHAVKCDPTLGGSALCSILSKCPSPHQMTENAVCSDRVGQTAVLTSNSDYAGDLTHSPKASIPYPNQEKMKQYCDKSKDTTVHSSYPLTRSSKMAKSSMSLHNSLPVALDFKTVDCQSNCLELFGLKSDRNKSSKRCISRPDIRADEQMSSDDELLLKVGAELDGGRKLDSDTESHACVGFTTASRKKIAISDSALSKAKHIFLPLLTDPQPVKLGKDTSTSPLLPKNDVPSGSGKVQDFRGTLDGEQRAAKRIEVPAVATSPLSCVSTNDFIGFATASRKKISVSNTALRRAEQLVTSLFDNEKTSNETSLPNGKYGGARMDCLHQAGTSEVLNPSENPSDEGDFNDLHAVKGLTNLFRVGLPRKGGQTDKAFKVPGSMRKVEQGASTTASVNASNCLIPLSPSVQKKMLGVKHLGDSQISVSDESLVKAVEMFEDLFG